jgi:glucokinase
MPEKKPVLAIDLGGTKIIAALVSPQGQVMSKENYPTLAKEGPSAVIDRIFSAIDHLLEAGNTKLSQLHGLSIAAAGAIDPERGVVTSSPNLAGWHDVPLRDIVSSKYKVKACLINDASAGALGEYEFGAGKGVSNLIFLTVGTGIGGGIIINGSLYLGPSGSAGEVGHTTIDVNGPRCSCGNIGCLETLASGTAMAGEAIRRISRGERSVLTEMVEDKLDNITAELVGMAAQGGDSLALEVISQAATYLGVGMVNLVNIFNPEMVIVGGGVAQMADLLIEPARQVVEERAFKLSAQAVRIVPTQLGDEAAVLGAAVFAYGQPA